ncbi:uncharacterized protein LOC126587846 [Malus sylvestris]|uniref:uncharacterized protein LOC126587846 n=1 Tax=Malus sylvestris TaxID=3752 RepID=UPI0021AD2DF9|nr:uncharacterized protein LOC126587846 [Malus sylvestris]
MMMCMRICIPTVIDKWPVAWRMLMLPFQKGLRRKKNFIEEDKELGVLWKKPYQEKRSLIRLQFHNILVVPMSLVLIHCHPPIHQRSQFTCLVIIPICQFHIIMFSYNHIIRICRTQCLVKNLSRQVPNLFFIKISLEIVMLK